MLEIYVDNEITIEQVELFLKTIFTGLKIFHCDLTFNLPIQYDSKDPEHIFFVFNRDNDKIEFKTQITIYHFPLDNEFERNYYVAKRISEYFKLNTLFPCALKLPEDEFVFEESIVFKDGIPFLVELKDSNIVYDKPNKIKIVRQLEDINYEFDKIGRLIKKICS